jgi:hypothetical protein
MAGLEPPRPLGALTRPPGRTVEEPDTWSLLRRLHVVAHHRHAHFEAAGGRREAVSHRAEIFATGAVRVYKAGESFFEPGGIHFVAEDGATPTMSGE